MLFQAKQEKLTQLALSLGCHNPLNLDLVTFYQRSCVSDEFLSHRVPKVSSLEQKNPTFCQYVFRYSPSLQIQVDFTLELCSFSSRKAPTLLCQRFCKSSEATVDLNLKKSFMKNVSLPPSVRVEPCRFKDFMIYFYALFAHAGSYLIQFPIMTKCCKPL